MANYELRVGPLPIHKAGAALDAALADLELDHQTLTEHAEHAVRTVKDLLSHGVAGVQHELTRVEVAVSGHFGAHRIVNGQSVGSNALTIAVGTYGPEDDATAPAEAMPAEAEPEAVGDGEAETFVPTTAGFKPADEVAAAKVAKKGAAKA